MDKLGYIPGDLVMTNGVPLGTKKGVVYRVTSSDPSKTLKLDDGTVLKGVVCLENIEGVEIGDWGYLSGDCCAWVKDIVPIPLSPAIFVTNEAFKLTFGLTFVYKNMGQIFSFSPSSERSGWKLRYGSQILMKNMEFVHEFQHILFSLGLNSKMRV